MTARLDGAGNIDDGGGASAVVLRAGSRMPGVEVATDDDDFVRKIAAGDLGDDVVDLNIFTDAIFKRELDCNGTVVEHALDQQHILQPNLRDGVG